MLIHASALLSQLDKELAELAAATLTRPPEDYAAFMRVVGRYQAMGDLRSLVLQLARKQEDET